MIDTYKKSGPKLAGIALLMLALNLLWQAAYAQVVPAHFYNKTIISGMNKVEGVVFDHLNRIYAWEKNGVIWIIDSNGIKNPVPLLDITDEVGSWVDHGLNGVVLDPDYRHNGYIYVNYTVDRHYLLYYGTSNYNADSNLYNNATIARVTRYTVDTSNFNSVIPGSRKILIGQTKQTGIPVTHKSHGSCAMVFATDGTLLIATGDGSSYGQMDNGSGATTWAAQALLDSIITPQQNVGAFRSQQVQSMNGKILRIDPNTGYGIPSNPYYDASAPASAKSLVWCLGLRNPYTISIKPGSGSTNPADGKPGVIYIGNVGWAKWESLFICDKPKLNFGWPLFEGLDYNANYKAALTANPFAPNPLFGSGGCTQQYFNFNELLIQETLDTASLFANPCDTTQKIPDSIYRFMHCRQMLDYRHHYDSVMVAVFNGTEAARIMIDDPASPCKGLQFDGDCVIAGDYYNSTAYPNGYRNQIYFGEYEDGWIRRLKTSADNKLKNVYTFADGLGFLTHVGLNPNTGDIVYVSYPDRIGKICYACEADKPPVAVITADTTSGFDTLTVHFSALNSYDPDHSKLTYLWKFGNFATSTKAKPVKTFIAPHQVEKTFLVTLTVTDDSSHTATDSLYIRLNNSDPVVKIMSPADMGFYSSTTAQTVNLNALVTDNFHADSDLHYVWHTTLFDNGLATSISEDTLHATTFTYTATGCNHIYSYQTILTVTDPEGHSGADTVNTYPDCAAPAAGFTTSATTYCKGSTITFTNTSTNTTTYQWLFPGGSPLTSTDVNPVVNYAVGGNYTVTLIATNNYGLTDTLVKTNYLQIVAPPALTLNYSGSDSVCVNQNVLLYAATSSNVSYQWYKNGIAMSGQTDDTLITAGAANYKVIVTSTAGCTSSKSKMIYNRQIDAVVVASALPPYCYGSDFYLIVQNANQYNSFTWTRNNAAITGATDDSLLINKGGTYQLTATTATGCTALSTPVLVDLLPTISVTWSGPLTFCNGDSVVFSTPLYAGYSYQWKKNAVDITGATGNTYTATSTGKYSVFVQSSEGCTAQSTKYNVNVSCRTNGFTDSAISNVTVMPNPAETKTTLRFLISEKKTISIALYDASGKQLSILAKNKFDAGNHEIAVETIALQAGMYYIKFFDGKTEMGSIELVRK